MPGRQTILSQRVLYHFDGDTQDSSCWSYCTSFRWDKGASLTYMDEGTFNGSLYLDETEHDFTITLPNNDVSGDFTLQFRYYQSHTDLQKTGRNALYQAGHLHAGSRLPVLPAQIICWPLSVWMIGLTIRVAYCLSVLLSDGSYSYVVFTTRGSSVGSEPAISQTLHNSNVHFNFLKFYDGSYTYWGFQIYSTVGSTLDIVYMDLVQGTKPSFKLEWQSAVYSSGQLQDSPVLAVRSNLDVSSYQIGGVRPSYPQRAQVWALVEDSRITSLQQYNGSAWVAVDGRIWTGSRWIPYSSFDVFTLKDLWDAGVDATVSVYTYIDTESGVRGSGQTCWRSWTGGSE